MDRSELSAPNAQFMLTSVTTVAVPEARTFHGPEDGLRLLLAHNGSCTLVIDGRDEPLVGDRMVLLRGAASCRVERATEDLLLSLVDFTCVSCVEGAYPLSQLYRHYPEYRLYCQREDLCLSFHDRFALVRFTVRSIPQYAAFDVPQRQQHLSIALSYMMLAIAAAAQDRSRQRYQCNKHVRRALQYMHDNYMRSITAADIAAHIGVHPGHLHRLFRAEIGTRVTEYLTRLRIEKAKSLLRRTDIPIAVITSFVGISSQQYLSRLFKQHVGMTPQAYRRSYNVTCDYEAARGHYDVIVYSQRERMEAAK